MYWQFCRNLISGFGQPGTKVGQKEDRLSLPLPSVYEFPIGDVTRTPAGEKRIRTSLNVTLCHSECRMGYWLLELYVVDCSGRSWANGKWRD